jgi:hypothetical protein
VAFVRRHIGRGPTPLSRRLASAREIDKVNAGDDLRVTIFKQREIARGEIADELPLLVKDPYVDFDHTGVSSKGCDGILRRMACGSGRPREYGSHDGRAPPVASHRKCPAF